LRPFSGSVRILWEFEFQKTDLDLIFAEESGHARFERFASSQSISLCDLVVSPGLGFRVRNPHLQPVSQRLAGLRQKVWPALLGMS
jgi:hypothetical protein